MNITTPRVKNRIEAKGWFAFANGLQKVSRNFATDNSGQEVALPYPCPSAIHLIIYIGEYETDLSDYGGLRELREPD